MKKFNVMGSHNIKNVAGFSGAIFDGIILWLKKRKIWKKLFKNFRWKI